MPPFLKRQLRLSKNEKKILIYNKKIILKIWEN